MIGQTVSHYKIIERLGGGSYCRLSVTRKLDLLVVADPDPQSGKAKKARAYGTRLMAADVFWRSIAAK